MEKAGWQAGGMTFRKPDGTWSGGRTECGIPTAAGQTARPRPAESGAHRVAGRRWEQPSTGEGGLEVRLWEPRVTEAGFREEGTVTGSGETKRSAGSCQRRCWDGKRTCNPTARPGSRRLGDMKPRPC